MLISFLKGFFLPIAFLIVGVIFIAFIVWPIIVGVFSGSQNQIKWLLWNMLWVLCLSDIACMLSARK